MQLGLIRKTRTVTGKGLLLGLEKQTYVLCLGSSLPCYDFEFGADKLLGVVDPVEDIRARFGH